MGNEFLLRLFAGSSQETGGNSVSVTFMVLQESMPGIKINTPRYQVYKQEMEEITKAKDEDGIQKGLRAHVGQQDKLRQPLQSQKNTSELIKM